MTGSLTLFICRQSITIAPPLLSSTSHLWVVHPEVMMEINSTGHLVPVDRHCKNHSTLKEAVQKRLLRGFSAQQV